MILFSNLRTLSELSMWIKLTLPSLPTLQLLGFSNSSTIAGNEEEGRVSKLLLLTWKMRGRTANRTQVLCLDFTKAVIRTTLLCNRKSGLLRIAKWRFTNWTNHAKKMSNCNNRFSYSCLPKEQRLGPLPSIDHKAHNYLGSTFQ